MRIKKNNIKMSKSICESTMNNYGFIMGIRAGHTLTEFDLWYKSHTISKFAGMPLPIFKGITVNGFRIMMPSDWYDRFIFKQPKYILNNHKIELKASDFVIFTIGDCLGDEKRLGSLANDLISNEVEFESLVECYISSETMQPEPGRIAQIWQEAIGSPIIPFDKNERQKIIDRLDAKFKRHIEQWSSKVVIRRKRS
jgi:hypothetical protein